MGDKKTRWQALFDWLHDIATSIKTNGLSEERHYNLLAHQLNLVLNDNVYLREAIEKLREEVEALTQAQIVRGKSNAEDHDVIYRDLKHLHGDQDSVLAKLAELRHMIDELRDKPCTCTCPQPYYPYWYPNWYCATFSVGTGGTFEMPPDVKWDSELGCWELVATSTNVQGGCADTLHNGAHIEGGHVVKN